MQALLVSENWFMIFGRHFVLIFRKFVRFCVMPDQADTKSDRLYSEIRQLPIFQSHPLFANQYGEQNFCF